MAIQVKTLESAINDARKKLRHIDNKLKIFEFPEFSKIEFSTEQMNVEDIIKDIPIGNGDEDYIYIFKVKGKTQSNRECISILEHFKNTLTDVLFPRINHDNKGTQYLYVGRSHKLRNRMSHHLSNKYIKTYGLHMECWVRSVSETIEIQYFKLTNEDNLVVQSIEDALWEKFRPAFGRKGDK
ncbi:hypothetical protein GRJ22_04780 [Photobacterium carnosum]|uniref:hypothetical protein n=1 Tax=Photobacterium carnosum TaxID=2023717 RepID=UPI001E4C09DF|nr:hypothetical protein [Photobacterium carnosum]MCD9555765.1 hypothetical protein [Photobacterium carnosum]